MAITYGNVVKLKLVLKLVMTLPNDTKQKHLLKERKCIPSGIYPNKDFAFPYPRS